VRRPYLDTSGPIPIAHRGGASLWPENTLVAFQGALDLGIRWIETDVHLTSDGHVVLFHDETLERTTDGTGQLREHTLAQLQALDAGHHFVALDGTRPHRGTGVAIPTLEQALALAPDVRLNLEIKQSAPPMHQALIDEIERLDAADRVLVASGQDALVQAARTVCGGRLASSAGRDEIIAFWLRAHVWNRGGQPAYDALQVPARHYGVPVVTRRFVQTAHDLDLAVHVWTIDEPDEMRRLLALGVDAIMSDRPDLLVAVLPPTSP
jgi:glycerophosphoryl diester phosphodiesterase